MCGTVWKILFLGKPLGEQLFETGLTSLWVAGALVFNILGSKLY